MSEKSERPGWKWAQQHAGYCDYAEGGGDRTTLQLDSFARVILDDERRALVMAALTGLVAQDITYEETALTAARQADAVLARYDEEVGGA